MGNRRKGTVINRMFRSYILASVLVMVAVPLHGMTDGILLGHAVTPDALSLIALLVPLNTFFFAFKMVFVSGNSINAARAYGSRDEKKMSEVFTVAISSLVTSIVALVVLAYIFLPQFTSIFCSRESPLYPMLYEYLQVILLQFPILAISSAFDDFFRITGKAKLVSKVTTVSCLSNIVLTYVFLFWFHLGIRGAAVATIICIAGSKLMFIPCLRRGEFPFRFVRMDMSRYFSILKDGIRTGLPISVMQILVAVTFYATNSIILKSQGPGGMFLWSVVLQMVSLCEMVTTGFNGVTQHIGSVLLGEDDYEGYRMLLKRSFVRFAILLFAEVALAIIFPDTLVSVFGANEQGEVMEGFARYLRPCLLMIIPLNVCGYITTALTVEGKVKSATTFNVLSTSAIMLSAFASNIFGPQLFWYILPLAEFLILLALFAMTSYVHHRDRSLSWFALMPLVPNEVALQLELYYDNSNLKDSLDKVRGFIGLAELNERQSFAAMICCEEMIGDITGSRKDSSGSSFEMRMLDKPDKLIIITKEAGVRREWNYYETEDSLSTRLIRNFAPSLSYNYYNGVSVTTVGFRKELLRKA